MAVQNYFPVILLAAGGFLVGGAYVTWKSAKFVALVLAVVAAVAIAGGFAWLF